MYVYLNIAGYAHLCLLSRSLRPIAFYEAIHLCQFTLFRGNILFVGISEILAVLTSPKGDIFVFPL